MDDLGLNDLIIVCSSYLIWSSLHCCYATALPWTICKTTTTTNSNQHLWHNEWFLWELVHAVCSNAIPVHVHSFLITPVFTAGTNNNSLCTFIILQLLRWQGNTYTYCITVMTLNLKTKVNYRNLPASYQVIPVHSYVVTPTASFNGAAVISQFTVSCSWWSVYHYWSQVLRCLMLDETHSNNKVNIFGFWTVGLRKHDIFFLFSRLRIWVWNILFFIKCCESFWKIRQRHFCIIWHWSALMKSPTISEDIQ